MIYVDLDGVIATQSKYAFKQEKNRKGRNFFYINHYFSIPKITPNAQVRFHLSRWS